MASHAFLLRQQYEERERADELDPASDGAGERRDSDNERDDSAELPRISLLVLHRPRAGGIPGTGGKEMKLGTTLAIVAAWGILGVPAEFVRFVWESACSAGRRVRNLI